MKRWLRRIGIVLLALFVLVAALWTASRVRGPTAEQRQALALFEAEPELPGSNAFPALWLLQWDVPEDEQAAIAGEDAERFHDLPPLGSSARADALKGFRSIAADRYEDLETALSAEPASCGMREDGCLARIRAERDAHAQRLERSGSLVDRVEAVFDHDHYRNLLPPALDMPFPRLQLMSLALGRHALDFVDGDIDAAIAGTCRALGGWRRLAGNSDSLLVAMYAVAGIEGHAGLLAEMLAETPVDHPLPGACQAALAPVQAGEMGLCQAMRGEWAFGRTALDVVEGDEGWGGFQRRLVLDRQATDALAASNLSWACGAEAVQFLVEDRPMQPAPQKRGLLRFECVANLVGCLLMDMAGPAYADYGLRMQDARARIGLLHTLEWMRGQVAAGEGTAARLLAQMPDGPGGAGRKVGLDPETGRLRMELFHRRADNTHWSIPLPPALQEKAEEG